jgi:hypothetical protein
MTVPEDLASLLSVAIRSLWISAACKLFRLRYIKIISWSIEITDLNGSF